MIYIGILGILILTYSVYKFFRVLRLYYLSVSFWSSFLIFIGFFNLSLNKITIWFFLGIIIMTITPLLKVSMHNIKELLEVKLFFIPIYFIFMYFLIINLTNIAPINILFFGNIDYMSLNEKGNLVEITMYIIVLLAVLSLITYLLIINVICFIDYLFFKKDTITIIRCEFYTYLGFKYVKGVSNGKVYFFNVNRDLYSKIKDSQYLRLSVNKGILGGIYVINKKFE